MTKSKAPPEIYGINTFREEFHRLLGRLVHETAQFDFYIGLQLNWLGDYYKVDLGDLLDPKKSQLNQRLKKLRQITMRAYQRAGDDALAEFSEWFDRADNARALRNDYVHGRWGVPGKYDFKFAGRLMDADPLLTFVPLNWDISPDQADSSISMTMQEFAQQVDAAQILFAEHHRLSNLYMEFAKLGIEGLN